MPHDPCTSRRRPRPWRLFALGLLLGMLAACSAPGIKAPPETAPRPDAAAAFARGAYAEAAEAWQLEALQAAADRAAALQVSAADAWLLADDAAAAERALRGVSRTELSPADQARLDLVLADLALRALRPDEADALLRQAEGALPAASRGRYRDLQAQAQQLLAGPASRGLARAAQISGNMGFYNADAAVEVLRALEDVSSNELAVRAANPRADRQFAGWLDLALVSRQNLVAGDGIGPAVTAWKGRHPYHLLTEAEALDSWLRYRQLFTPPRRTAVLLPDSGGLQGAAEAIRDGLLSAYLGRPGGGELMFFSSGDDGDSTLAGYFSALDAGADQIIGPLRKESVEALLNLPGLVTPVLALNDLPEGFTPPAGLAGRLTGMSLSQEAEVQAVAANAAAHAYQRAIVVAPESVWGERMAAAFQDEFLQGDRQILAATRYPESENDHSAVLERLLRIDESKARAQRLENVLQVPLEFEPTRRTDVDVIFMAANSTQARLIRPQLRFLDAGDVPVYATGRIYSGRPDPAGNQDLDGVRFPLTPWELDHSTAEDIPQLASLRNGALGSLFALGQDAWTILSWLDLMRKDPDFIFHGQSGDYRMDMTGKLERQPAWGEFSLGRPVALAPHAQPTLQPTQQPALQPERAPTEPGPPDAEPAQPAEPPGR